MNRMNCEINSDRWLSLEDFDGESWKDIPKYEGLYQVSNYGRVKSLNHDVFYKSKKGKIVKDKKIGRVLKAADNGNGYLWVNLWNKKPRLFYVHRLVAESFIANPHNMPQINHRDENKQNNFCFNLEWCDARYNNNYGTARIRGTNTLIKNGNNRAIDVYDTDGNFINTYDCAYNLEKDGYNRRSAYNVAYHRAKSYKGFVFRFRGEPFSFKKSHNHNHVKVLKYDSKGVLVATYDSIAKAEKANGFGRNYLYSVSYAKTREPVINGYRYVFK
jgi:hypothetical protein